MTPVAVGIVFCTRRGILMLERGDGSGVRWAFPGGKLDSEHDSDLSCAAAREVEEETGVRVCQRPQPRSIWARRHPVTGAHLHYFLMRPLACAHERNLEPGKHLSVAWWTPEEVLDRLRHQLADRVAEEIGLLAKASLQRRTRRRARDRRRRELEEFA